MYLHAAPTLHISMTHAVDIITSSIKHVTSVTHLGMFLTAGYYLVSLMTFCIQCFEANL